MTNPNNAIGTNGAYGGRTSVDAFNDVLGIFSARGVISGFTISPDTGLTVSVGGDGISRDVAAAEDNVGNKTTINNINKSPISITIPGAPANNSRIDSIVAYVNRPAQGTTTAVDNPDACGIIVVSGTVASTPVAPDDNTIRTAITSDGASGTVAYYVVLGNITIPNGTTTITSEMITQGTPAPLQSVYTDILDGSITTNKIADGAITTAKILAAAITADKIDWSTVEDITTTGTLTSDDTHAIYIRFASGLQVAMGLYNDNATIYKNTYIDKTITFSKQFISIPYTVVGMYSDSTSPDLGVMTVSRASSSATQLVARVFYNNAGTSGRKPGVEWLALGFWK